MSTTDVIQPKVAVVTGGAMGIGAAVAHQLAMQGHQVWIADRDIDAATQTTATLNAQGYAAHAIEMDVGEAESVAIAFEFIRQTAQRCDILVNSSGVASVADFLNFPLAEFEHYRHCHAG